MLQNVYWEAYVTEISTELNFEVERLSLSLYYR